MRHFFQKIIVAAFMIGGGLTQVNAQQMPPIPVDQKVRIGRLENGLTYYIRQNKLPENRAEFYIAQKVGSILEEPQQRGLAHFLEHMCFNGTKNFPGDERGLGIVPWCESKGIQFGRDLNAYTSVEQTVYNISNVPTTDQAVVDSCLLILHDWSNAVMLNDKDIDDERGVIHEEWRSRNSGMFRLYTEAQATLYPDSKYADCMPIGSIDVIDNFPYDAIRSYYKKWYRPDLQGIIVVGDIDVDAMEASIKRLWADVPAPVNPAKRTIFPVGDNKEPLIYIGKDKEVNDPSIMLFFKHEQFPDSLKGNMMYLLQDYIVSMATSMLNARLDEICQGSNPPFVYAGSYDGDYFLCNTKAAFTLSIGCKGESMKQAFEAGLAELERVRRYGFTEGEYSRARANYLQHLESSYNEREKTKSNRYVQEYVNHFLSNEPIPGIEYEYATMNQIAPNIPLAAINQVIQQANLISEENQAVFIAVPDKEGVTAPTQEEVATLLKGMKSLDVKPYEDKVSNEPLMSEAPQGGKIVSEKANALFGATELTLSNGIKVYVKQTDFKADEILMKGYSLGGTSLFGNEDKLNFSVMSQIMEASGVANFSNTDLTKMLAGKKVNVHANVSTLSQGVNGNCSPKDLETLLQLVYLGFTAPRKDAEAFESWKTRTKAQLESAEANPLYSINDSIGYAMYGYHPRFFTLKANLVDQVNLDRVYEMYKQCFANAGDFTFFFVGNIDLATAKPLIASYLGSLPSTGKQGKWVDHKMNIAKGQIVNEYAKEQQTPMATNFMLYSGTMDYTQRNLQLLNLLVSTLNIVYTEEIREKEGGTYGVSCMQSFNKLPQPEVMLQIVYQTDPAKKEHLNGLINQLFVKMSQEGPTAEQLDKARKVMLKRFTDNQKENSYWLNALYTSCYEQFDVTKDYESTLNSLTAADVAKLAADLLKQGNKITVIMTAPEEKK